MVLYILSSFGIPIRTNGMLDILIENFEETFLPKGNSDRQEMIYYLEREWDRINDASHLEQMVIGKAEFEWDFRVLKEGFEGLIHPFSQDPSHVPILFLHCLRDLGCSKDEYKHALIFLEYCHYIIGINDYFNFQRVFTQDTINLEECSRLTQIKYAGQFITTYPSYLFINNLLDVSVETNNKLHQLVFNITAALGISRGVLAKWTHRRFADVTVEMYSQNAINSLSHFLIFPVILAATLARVPDNDILLLKKAFSHLTLFAKLRLERAISQSDLEVDISPSYMNSYRILTFPGVPFISNNLTLEHKTVAGQKWPHFPDIYAQIVEILRSDGSENTLAATRALEEQSFEAFTTTIQQTGLLGNTVKNILKSFNL